MTEAPHDMLPPQKPAILFLGKLKMGTQKMQQDLKREIALAKARLSRPSSCRPAKPKPVLTLLRKLPDLDKLRRP
jgi:hypothetical protein